jgi:hypothetical protein
VTYEETLGALQDIFGDQHLAASYRSQLKSRTQGVGESLQKFATAIEHLAHIRREAGKAFADEVEDSAIKIQLLLGGEKTLNEALRQALELKAVLIGGRTHKTGVTIFSGSRSPSTGRRGTTRSACWSCGEPGQFWGNCSYGRKAETRRKTS